MGFDTDGKIAAVARSKVPWALAGGTIVVDSIAADKRLPAFPAVEPRDIFGKAGEVVAVCPAAVVVEKGPAQATGAVLTMLAHAEIAGLTVRWFVSVGCALAAKVDTGAHDPAVLTSEWVETATLELADPH